jgi:single-stranded-DNA-specific exonuclease
MNTRNSKRSCKPKLHETIRDFLREKNITTEEEIDQFLYPSLGALPDPDLMSGMEKAVEYIYHAIEREQDIIIWGDYDVDGVTGTSLLVRFFASIGVRVRFHLPNRFKDGYGLNRKSLDVILNQDEGLLITVDCGISNKEEIAYAQSKGYCVIVTDHHEPGDVSISADSVVNPKVSDCKFPDKNLAGVGVAFYLAAAIRKHLKGKGFFINGKKEPNLKQFLDLVAIGTIADIVPLKGVNRILVRSGFEVLESTENPGIRELLASCDIRKGFPLTSDDIGFQVAPKLNAAGRMGEGVVAVELLLSDDNSKAAHLAMELTKLNKSRKATCQENLELALSNVSKDQVFNNKCLLESGDYHQGVIGIVASQLVEKYNYPVLLFSQVNSENGEVLLKGSGRSIQGLNLYECLAECEGLLMHFGGHKMAAGLTLKQSNYELFKDVFTQVVQRKLHESPIENSKTRAVKLSIETVFSKDYMSQINLLEPFGEGNERPIFEELDPLICSSKSIGKDNSHLRVTFRGRYENHEGIGFGLGGKLMNLKTSEHYTIHFTPMLNRFNRSCKWQVKIVDIR